MTKITRLLLALFLAISVAPAFAQAPPAVPSEPDTERRTRYSGVSSSTGPFLVGFDLYGDSTDYQNWIEVWVNGVQVQQSGNWTLQLGSGSLTTLSRPILGSNASIVFTAAQTGTVDIVGARRPRRTSQLSESRGVTARDFNQIVTDLWMTERERWDRDARTIMAPPGDTLSFLPPAASRINRFICFDAVGQLSTCTATTGSTTYAAGTGISFTGSAPVTIAWNPTAGAGVAISGATISTVVAANSQTADYTIQTSDCSKTVSMGGGLKTVTLPSAAGFTAGCEITIKNVETTRGKKTSGFPSDVFGVLWPLQSVRVKNVSSAWVTVEQQGRWLLPTTAELCVRQDGNDTSDGLGNGSVAADCFKTIQAAVLAIGKQWDGGGYSACNIGLYAGGTNTFSETVSQTGQSVGCYLSIYFRGAVTWTATAQCYTTGDNAIIIFYMNVGFVPTFQCNTSNTAATCAFYGHQTVIFDWFGSFQWVPGGSNDCLVFFDAQGRGVMSLTGGGLVVGDGSARTFGAMFQMDAHAAGFQVSGTIGFSPNVSCTRMFVAKGGSWVNSSVTISGTCTGITTSQIWGNSVLKTNGSTIYGGTTTAGGGGAGLVCTTDC